MMAYSNSAKGLILSDTKSIIFSIAEGVLRK